MHIVNLIFIFLFLLEKEITCLRGGVAVKPNEAPWVIFIRKKAVPINSDSNEIFPDFAHCETLSVTFQNDVLKFQKAFRGIYHLSKLVNGKPSFSRITVPIGKILSVKNARAWVSMVSYLKK